MTDCEFPILPTTHGYIKGRQCTSLYGQTYYSFEKIPFARPPLGELRFRAPQPAVQWSNILDCLECPQKPAQRHAQTKEFIGVEDCLYLNVYVKTLQSDNPLPVVVYLFGGGFMTGGAVRENLGPDYFMHENIVLVTINYRLGALGFLRLEDKSLQVPGNAGLKDQLAGLKWFKSNCINFNGDPNNITLVGHSAGAACVQYMLMTPLAKGLFHKAVMMAGSALSSGAFIEPSNYAYRLAAANGYKGEETNEAAVLDYLRQLKTEDITLNITTEAERNAGIRLTLFLPTIESYESDTCILSKHPAELLPNAWGYSLPLMIGGNSDESLMVYPILKNDERFFTALNEQPELLVPYEVRQAENDREKCAALGRHIIEKYLDNDLSKENILAYIKLSSVNTFWYYVYRSVLSRLKHAPKSKLFLYNFDFDSPNFNLYRLRYCANEIRGVSHADELCYLFRMAASFKLDEQSDEFMMIRRMVSMWCAFADKGSPNCREISPALWLPLESEEPMMCMNINKEMKMRELPQLEMLQFWHKMYEKLPL